MNSSKIKVLVVDDTIIYRKLLSEVVESLPDTELAGTAPNGKVALQAIKNKQVDLVFLDVQMPVMDGLETLEHLRREHPQIGVIMVSGVDKAAARITIEALEKGALDFIPKPAESSPGESLKRLTEDLSEVVELFKSRRQGRPEAVSAIKVPETRIEPLAEVEALVSDKEIAAVMIGVSTGGPKALASLIPKLPGDLGVPVFIVQHMPPLFTKSLAESLDKNSQLKVVEASNGQQVDKNTAYIAPGGMHMVVRGAASISAQFTHSIGTNDNPPEHGCRPAADVLFRSGAIHYGSSVLAVVLTGMGSDGRDGVKALKRKKALCLTQSKDSCVIYGMPMAVDQAGLSDESVAIERMAERITEIVRASRRH